MNFLDKITPIKKREIQALKKEKPLNQIKKECSLYLGKRKIRSLSHALTNTTPPAIIAEIKLKSPSKGVLTSKTCEDIAELYANSQADAISVLTDKPFFYGDIANLKKTRALTLKPIFRKDFIIDPYQIYQTFLAGGDAFLLIAAMLSAPKLKQFIALGKKLGLENIVEVHNKEELKTALKADAKIIGINNRNLKTLKVDIAVTEELIKFVQAGKVIISESGIFSKEDVKKVITAGAKGILAGTSIINSKDPQAKISELKQSINSNKKSMKTLGKFGKYGGLFVPETLVPALCELEAAYNNFKKDKKMQARLNYLLKDYAGRPTPLYYAENLSKKLNLKIYLKREDLLHGGAHKTNNGLGQGLLAKYMGKKRIIAETGAGQHGFAAAMIGALFGIPTEVYMGVEDIKRQHMNVLRMKATGAKIVPVEIRPGVGSLKDAVNEALRDWVTNVRTTYYLIGSVVGPHPYPTIVRDFQKIIGEEIKEQLLQKEKKLPDCIIACVGGGSNAIGAFHNFINDKQVDLIGVEAAGLGLDTDKHGASITRGQDGILHGSLSKVLQDKDGQIKEAYSISAGLDYPGVGPEHTYLANIKRVKYDAVTDQEALDAFSLLSRTEGIIPALESSHAVAYLIKNAKNFKKDDIVVINLSGRGDKDMEHVYQKE